jgi:hypothetical protein
LWVTKDISDSRLSCHPHGIRKNRLTIAACSPWYTFYNGLIRRFWFSFSAHYTVRFSIDTRFYVFIRHLAFLQIDPRDLRHQHTLHCLFFGDIHVYIQGDNDGIIRDLVLAT